ncbi:hypothetical protein OLZ31_02260 [Enterobacter asburiae]|nr:hypothetical protein [Enterobacter asburiae]
MSENKNRLPHELLRLTTVQDPDENSAKKLRELLAEADREERQLKLELMYAQDQRRAEDEMLARWSKSHSRDSGCGLFGIFLVGLVLVAGCSTVKALSSKH